MKTKKYNHVDEVIKNMCGGVNSSTYKSWMKEKAKRSKEVKAFLKKKNKD